MAAENNQYELTFIVSGVLSDDRTQRTVQSVTDFIKDNGGEILEVDEWGSQRLAYEIDKKRSGYYTTVYFKASGELIPRLERTMTINDDILRYLTLHMEPEMIRYHRQRGQKVEAGEEESE